MKLIKRTRDNALEPSPRYAKIAGLARAFGAKVRDDDFEQIDAFIEAIQEWQAEQKQDVDTRDADFLRSLGIQPLQPLGGNDDVS